MATTHFTIYLLTNLVNGKYYVGQTTRTLAHRWSVHKSEARTARTASGYLYKAIRKYGADAFVAETLATTTDIDELNRLEAVWILVLDAMNPRVGYNGAGGGRNRIVTAATRAKNSALRLGRPLTAEHRAKISLSTRGKPKSAAHAQHIREALTGRRPSPQAIAAVALANTRRTVSAATSEKLRAAQLKGHLGVPKSPTCREHIRAALKARAARGK